MEIFNRNYIAEHVYQQSKVKADESKNHSLRVLMNDGVLAMLYIVFWGWWYWNCDLPIQYAINSMAVRDNTWLFAGIYVR